MSGGIQKRIPKMTATPEPGDLTIFSSPEQQFVANHRSPMNSFEMSADEETTTAATMTISSEAVDLYLRPKKQRIQDHGFDTSAPGKTKTAAETDDSICCTSGTFDHSKTTETCRSGGGGVCSEDSLTKWDSTASCSTSRITAISIKQQTEELHTTVSCPYVDSGDQLIKLPDDLIREVLSRLDMKEIVRLGSLNTSWRSELRRILCDEGHIFSQYSSTCQQLDSCLLENDLTLQTSWSAHFGQLHCLLGLSPKDLRASYCDMFVRGSPLQRFWRRIARLKCSVRYVLFYKTIQLTLLLMENREIEADGRGD